MNSGLFIVIVTSHECGDFEQAFTVEPMRTTGLHNTKADFDCYWLDEEVKLNREKAGDYAAHEVLARVKEKYPNHWIITETEVSHLEVE